MNEEPQNSQINNQQSEENKSQAFPSWAKIVSALLVILVIIGLYLVFAKSKNTNAPAAPAVQEQSKINQPENQIPASGQALPENENQAETNAAASQDATNTVDVDYEVKKMDEAANSVDDNDFSSGSFSNAEIGL